MSKVPTSSAKFEKSFSLLTPSCQIVCRAAESGMVESSSRRLRSFHGLNAIDKLRVTTAVVFSGTVRGSSLFFPIDDLITIDCCTDRKNFVNEGYGLNSARTSVNTQDFAPL